MSSPTAEQLRRRVATLLVVRASGHLEDSQRRYPCWELANDQLQRLLQEGVGGVILLGGSSAELRARTHQLQHCKIFVSVFGDSESQGQVLEGLQAASGFLRGELGRRLQMRRAPEVKFQLDRGLERGTSVLGLLNRLEDERQERGEIPPGSDELPDS